MHGYELDPTLLKRYMERRQADVFAIHAALEASRFDVIANLGHQWKGNAENFGFPDLAEIGRDLEIAAGDCDVERVRQLVGKFEAFVKSKRPKVKD